MYKSGGEHMKFIITEKNGKKPFDEWLIRNLKIYAEKEHGMKLDIKIKSDSEPNETTSE